MAHSITLQNLSDTDIVNNDILGQICFAAPNEAGGTDAILIAASMFARSEGTFAADNNATELVFTTGASESAAPGATNYDMTLSSGGNLTLAGNLELGHASDTTIARSSAGVITVEGTEVILAGAVTAITSLLATDIKIGEDDQTKIDFETADEIHFYAANVEQVYLADNIFGPQSDSDVDLGTTGVRWKDAYIDTITTTGAVDVGGYIYVPQRVVHKGDTDTYIEFTDDKIRILGGGKALITATEAAVDEVIINDGGLDCDFRVEGDNNANLFFVDGSTDRVGINTNEPTQLFDISNTLTYDGTTLLSSSATDNTPPIVLLKHAYNDTTGSILKFVLDKGAAGADGDVCGTITFFGDDDAQSNIEFARIEGVVADASNGDECGGLKFYVAENDGTNTTGLSLTGSTTDGEVDVTIGAGAASVTTVAGTLTMGSTAALTNAGLVAVANQSNITGVGTISSGTWQGTAIAHAYIGNDAIDGDNIADDSVNSEHYVDGSIDTAHIADDQVTLAKMAGLARGKIIYGDSSGNPAALAISSTDGHVLKSDGTDISWGAVTATVDIDSLSALGGTGLHQTQDHFMFSDNGTEKKITFSNLQDAVFADISGDATVAAGGALTIADDVISSAELADACSAVTSFTAPLIEGTTSIQTPLIEYTDGDDAITINDGGHITLAKASKPALKSNTDGSTVTFDLNEANVHTVTLGGNRTFAISNETAGQKFIIRILQDGTGSRTVTWFSTIKWAGGSAPTLTTTGGKADVVGFLVTGTDTYDGFVVGQNI